MPDSSIRASSLNDIYLKNSYPNIREAWILFVVCLLGQLVATPIQLIFGTGNALGLFLMYSIAMTIGLGFALWQKSLSFSVLNTRPVYFEQSDVDWPLYLLSILAIPCIALISGPITQLLPFPEEFAEQMEQILGNFGWLTFLTIAIAAPIFEELIFRGIILDGFLRQMEPRKAVLYAAFLFALMHMNPWQFLHTFLLGSFIGWIYYRTKSIWPCIFIHFVNNGLVFLAGAMAPESELINERVQSDNFMVLAVVPLGMLMLWVAIQVIEPFLDPVIPSWKAKHFDEEE